MLDIFVHCCVRGLREQRRKIHYALGRIEMGLTNYFALCQAVLDIVGVLGFIVLECSST